MEEAATAAAAVMEGDTPDSQVLIPEADFMEVAEVVGMVDTLAEATIMEDVIMVAMADTITEGMHQAGPYSELFWVE